MVADKSFSVRIYLQDGHAEGVKIVARSKWSGRALVIPRASLGAEIDRVELKTLGVYILIGAADHQGRQTLHIGAADPVAGDLAQHAADKSFWSWLIVCAAKDQALTHDHIRYIAARLIQLAGKNDRVTLDNRDRPEIPLLDASETAYAEAFLAHMLSVYPVLGLRAFESS